MKRFKSSATWDVVTSSEVSQEQAGPVLGWTSAVAAYGAFVIPKVFGEQINATTPEKNP